MDTTEEYINFKMNFTIDNYDANEPSYKAILYDMSVRNNFHPADVYTNIHNFEKIPPTILNLIPSLPTKQIRNEYLHNLMNHLKQEKKDYIVKGYIAYDQSKNIIGFLLYDDIIDNPVEIELTFILVDKEYRKSGVGTMLLNRFIDSFLDVPKIINVKIDSKYYVEKWYRKHEFITREECKQQYPMVDFVDRVKGDYKRLVYLTYKAKHLFDISYELVKIMREKIKK